MKGRIDILPASGIPDAPALLGERRNFTCKGSQPILESSELLERRVFAFCLSSKGKRSCEEGLVGEIS